MTSLLISQIFFLCLWKAAGPLAGGKLGRLPDDAAAATLRLVARRDRRQGGERVWMCGGYRGDGVRECKDCHQTEKLSPKSKLHLPSHLTILALNVKRINSHEKKSRIELAVLNIKYLYQSAAIAFPEAEIIWNV